MLRTAYQSIKVSARCYSTTLPHTSLPSPPPPPPIKGFLQLQNKSIISITGPDSTKFLNGLITSKLLPNSLKKKTMTLSTETKDESLGLGEFDVTKSNWGVLNESKETGNQVISRSGLYSMILNSKGRVNTDIFVYPTPLAPMEGVEGVPRYLIEVDDELLKKVVMIFKMHKLKADLKIEGLQKNDFKVWYFYNDSMHEYLYDIKEKYFNEESGDIKTPEAGLSQIIHFLKDTSFWMEQVEPKNILGFGFDDRCPEFGVKIITTSNINSLEEILSPFLLQDSLKISSQQYNIRRTLYGIPEGPFEMHPNDVLPLECNLDLMDGVHFDKGCYMGQELTVRTYHTGIIRKRIVPVRLFLGNRESELEEYPVYDPQDDVCDVIKGLNYIDILNDKNLSNNEKSETSIGSSPFGGSGKPVRSRRKPSSGTLLSTCGNLGLALVRLEDFSQIDLKFHIEIPGGGLDNSTLKVGVKGFIPYWWPEDV